jgi:activating signal cointegrator 1
MTAPHLPDQCAARAEPPLLRQGRLDPMKAISLWQPWASLWCSKRKVHETRHWRCSHRGWLLVHAAKRFETDFDLNDRLRLILDDEFGAHWAEDLPTGALIGMVNVVDCPPTLTPLGDAAASDDDRECGDFGPGRFAWKRDAFRLFEQPIPFRGRQGVFNVPDDVIPFSGRVGR